MDAIIVTLGTDGDVFPFAALGIKLRARGHRVFFVASAPYRYLAELHGFEYRELVSRAENDELFNNPDFWNPLKCAPLAARWGLRFVRRQYDLLAGLLSPGSVLVANPGVLAAVMVHEKFGIPMASVLLQPGLIPSSIAPPVLPGLLFMRRAPQPLWKLFWRGFDGFGHLLVGRTLNPIRASVGLKPVRRLFLEWISPQLVLGMFPEWFGRPQADWPPQIKLFGFPEHDPGANSELPPEVEAFCGGGAPPMAFTFGTGMVHSAKLFRSAIEAAQVLGTRAIFLTKYRNQLPDALPPGILHCAFAPFQKLFPHCAAIVHHAGVGTTAKAMAAGIPQLACPICFDQFDNAARIKELGVGDFVHASRLSGPRIARSISRMLTPTTKSRCEEIAQQFGARRALDAAADALEGLQAR